MNPGKKLVGVPFPRRPRGVDVERRTVRVRPEPVGDGAGLTEGPGVVY